MTHDPLEPRFQPGSIEQSGCNTDIGQQQGYPADFSLQSNQGRVIPLRARGIIENSLFIPMFIRFLSLYC